MADDEEPAVTLGEGNPVEGAPLARVSARLMWGIEHSTVVEREGDTVVRTPDGPRELREILADVDEPYFATRREFEDAVREVVGAGPVPTVGDDSPDADDEGDDTSDTEDGEGETDADDEGDDISDGDDDGHQ